MLAAAFAGMRAGTTLANTSTMTTTTEEKTALETATALIRRAREIRLAVRTLKRIAANHDRRFERDAKHHELACTILDRENIKVPAEWRVLAW